MDSMQVGLFITCLTDTFFPRVGAAAVAVLRHFDCAVRVPPEQTCCGQPAYNNGLPRSAAPLVDRLAPLVDAAPDVIHRSAVLGPDRVAARVNPGQADRMGAAPRGEDVTAEMKGVSVTGLDELCDGAGRGGRN